MKFHNIKNNWHSSLKFYYNGCELEQVQQTTVLGVSFDHALSLKPHIEAVRKKLAPALYIYSNIRDVIPKHIARNLYYSLFHSHLMYCILTWGSTFPSHLEAINVLQHKILKVYLELPKRTPTNIVFQKANIPSLSNLFQLAIGKLIYKFIHSPHLLPSTIASLFQRASQIHAHATRTSSKADLFIIPCNTQARRNSAAYFCPSIWNTLPENIRSIPSFPIFQKKLKTYLITRK